MSYSRMYIFVAALLLAACDETTRVPSQDHALDQPTLADADLPDLARAISKALAAPAARHDILAAMRASEAVEHRLLLADYLRSPEGARLLAASAQAFAATGDEFLAKVDRIRNIAELAIAVPIRDHRLNWRGGPEIGVAGAWDPDALGFIVHEPDGGRRRATTLRALMGYGAFFIIRPQENWGTRINRQRDAPGQVIQDRNDGEQAVVWTYEVEGRPPVSVDHGQYESETSLREALAKATGHLPVAANSRCHGDQPPVNDECPVSGGGVRSRPTYLATFELTGGGDLGSSAEVEITVGYTNRNGVPVSGTVRREGVEEDEVVYVNDEILPVSPLPDGQPFWVQAVETDSWLAGGDDDLGSEDFGFTAGGRSFELTSINIRLNW